VVNKTKLIHFLRIVVLLGKPFFSWLDSDRGPRYPHCRGFENKLTHTTLSRTPADEWSVRRRNLYLKRHNNHKRQIFMLLAGFVPATLENDRSQPHALDRAVTWMGIE